LLDPVPQGRGARHRLGLGQRVQALLEFLGRVLRPACQQYAQASQLRRDLLPQHPKCLVLLARDEHPLAAGEQRGDQVGDRVSLAGAGRSLDHHTGLRTQQLDDPALLVVRRQREQRVLAEHVARRGPLLAQPRVTLRPFGVDHQLCQRDGHRGVWFPQRRGDLLVGLGEQDATAGPQDQCRGGRDRGRGGRFAAGGALVANVACHGQPYGQPLLRQVQQLGAQQPVVALDHRLARQARPVGLVDLLAAEDLLVLHAAAAGAQRHGHLGRHAVEPGRGGFGHQMPADLVTDRVAPAHEPDPQHELVRIILLLQELRGLLEFRIQLLHRFLPAPLGRPGAPGGGPSFERGDHGRRWGHPFQRFHGVGADVQQPGWAARRGARFVGVRPVTQRGRHAGFRLQPRRFQAEYDVILRVRFEPDAVRQFREPAHDIGSAGFVGKNIADRHSLRRVGHVGQILHELEGLRPRVDVNSTGHSPPTPGHH
jgi:hypothetical protein